MLRKLTLELRINEDILRRKISKIAISIIIKTNEHI
nr:MAG TPA: hypothetical protein [Caudoviricetes sp.]